MINDLEESRRKVGGLADPGATSEERAPSAFPPAVPTPPPRATQPPSPTPVVIGPPALTPEERVDAWICPRCKMANPLESIFCKGCGQTIGINCPNCQRLIEAIARFCPHCGTNVPLGMRRNELNAALANNQSELNAVQAVNPYYGRTQRISSLRAATVTAGAWMGVAIIGVIASLASWDKPLAVPADLSLFSPHLVFWIVFLIYIFALMIFRRRFSFSALVAGVAAFGLLMVQDLVAEAVGPEIYAVRTLFIASAYTLVSLICALALIGLGTRLSQLGCGVSFLVFLGLLASVATFAPQIESLTPVFLQYSDYAELAVYFDRTRIIGTGGYAFVTGCFGLCGLLAWRKTMHIEHELAVAVDDQREHIITLQREINKLSSELVALQTKM